MADYVPYVEDQPAFQPQMPVSPGFVPYTEPPETPVVKPTRTQELMRQLGLTARAGITGATGLAGMAADVPFQLANVGRAAFDKPPVALPSANQQRLMTLMGLPEPQGLQENLVQAGASILAGVGDPLSRTLQAYTTAKVPERFAEVQAAAKSKTVKELTDVGYKLPPTIADAGVGARTLEGIGGTARTAQMARAANEQVTNDLAAAALKLPKGTPLTQDVLNQQAQSVIREGYDPIRQAGTITTGRNYRLDLERIAKKYQPESFPADTSDKVINRINNLFVREFDANDAVNKISQLRMEAKDAFKPGGDSNYGNALRDLAKALEDNIELNLSKRGKNGVEMLTNFREARTLLAKNHAIENMLVSADSGGVSAVKAAALLSRGVPLTDELRTIAKAGSPVFSKATAFPTGGTPPPYNFGDTMFTGAGLGGAGTTGGLSLGLTAFPAAKYIARNVALSSPFQKAFVGGTGAAPTAGIFGSEAGRRGVVAASPAILPLFSSVEE